MTRTRLLALAVALTASMGAQASAQSTKMAARSDSKVTLAGGSNLHDWSCKSSELDAAIEVDSGFLTQPLTAVARPITRVTVTIPVKSLKCGKDKMDENMYKALKANEFPEIRYVLSSYDLTPGATTADGFAAQTTGELTVAGKSVRVEIPITAQRLAGGSARGEGTVNLRITDFGIKPPTALLGTLRTKNEIQITFQVLLDKSVVVALSQR